MFFFSLLQSFSSWWLTSFDNYLIHFATEFVLACHQRYTILFILDAFDETGSVSVSQHCTITEILYGLQLQKWLQNKGKAFLLSLSLPQPTPPPKKKKKRACWTCVFQCFVSLSPKTSTMVRTPWALINTQWDIVNLLPLAIPVFMTGTTLRTRCVMGNVFHSARGARLGFRKWV